MKLVHHGIIYHCPLRPMKTKRSWKGVSSSHVNEESQVQDETDFIFVVTTCILTLSSV